MKNMFLALFAGLTVGVAQAMVYDPITGEAMFPTKKAAPTTTTMQKLPLLSGTNAFVVTASGDY